MTHTTTHITNSTSTGTRADTASYPVIGQVGTTAAAMRAAADLLEAAGIAGLSVSCTDQEVTVQVTEELADAVGRARLVARLGAASGATAVRIDSPDRPLSWVRADANIGGLRFRVFTAVGVQHTDAGPLAADPAGRIAQAATLSTGNAGGDGSQLPAGWRWLTDLDPDPAADTQAGVEAVR
jgi:hypothetical protein